MMSGWVAFLFIAFAHLAVCADSLNYSTKLGPNGHCDEARMFFKKEGISLPVPDNSVPGTELSICVSEHTCCTKQMEDEIVSHSIRGFTRNINDRLSALSLNYKEFDHYFQKLIENSKVSLDTLFAGTYRSHYTENSAIFMSLFDDIENYYRGGVVDLRDIFDSFFTTLMQQVFKLMHEGADVSDEYMQCIADNMHVIQPFGDISEKLSRQMQRAFIDAKTFVHGLAVGEQVVSNLAKVYPSKQCLLDLVTMDYCPKCNGQMLKPCRGQCDAMMKGCLCDLRGGVSVMWNKYIDAMTLLLVRLDGPFNIKTVLTPLDVKISEAIMLLQDHRKAIEETVTKMCGDVKYRQNASSESGFDLSGLSRLKLLGSLGDLGNSPDLESDWRLENIPDSEKLGSVGGLDFFDSSSPEHLASDLEKHADISKRSIDEQLEGDIPLKHNKKRCKRCGTGRKRRRRGKSGSQKKRSNAKDRRRRNKHRSSKAPIHRRRTSVTPTSAAKFPAGLKSMVEGMKSNLSRIKNFWRNLSVSLCHGETAEKETSENCQSGMDMVERSCGGDRIENITQWRVLIQPQVRILAEVTFKVKQAYHGIDPMLSENDDDAYFTDMSTSLGEEGTYSGEIYLMEGSADGGASVGKNRVPNGDIPFDMGKVEEKNVGDLEPHQVKWIEQTLGEPVAPDTSLSEIQERLAQHPDAKKNNQHGEELLGGQDSQWPHVTRSTTTGGSTTNGKRLEYLTLVFSVALCYFILPSN